MNEQLREDVRQQNIAFIVWAIKEVEGVEVPASEFEEKSYAELEELVKWYDYLLDK